MARIAFYAPMKSPHHPVPSGDRQMARLVLKALKDFRGSGDFRGIGDLGGSGDRSGDHAELVSEFRSYEGRGETAAQEALFEQAATECARLHHMHTAKPWDIWVTYHNYYKAPDLLGPRLSAAFGIPYVLIEATRSRKRLSGPWAQFAAEAEAANDAAQVIFYLTARDAIALKDQRPRNQRLVHLRPFLDKTSLPGTARTPAPEHARTLLSVGMMRGPDKLASYARIAETLPHLTCPDWRLTIIGDGPQRTEVEAMFAPFGTRIHFAGLRATGQMDDAYAQAAAFFWPGVNEAFGMVYLESQAAGLPVIAEDRPGVRDVLARGAAQPVDDPAQLARALDALLMQPAQRKAAAAQALAFVRDGHLFPNARDQISTAIETLLTQKD